MTVEREFDHPLARDVSDIHTAAILGQFDAPLGDDSNIKVKFFNPLENGSNVSVVRIADWSTDDMTAIFMPLDADPGDTTWQVICEDGFAPVRQRIFTRDILGRGFPLTIGEVKVVSGYVQLDIIDEGVVLSVESADAGEKEKLSQQSVYAGYESEAYDTLYRIAQHYSSIRAVVELARAA